MPNNDIISSQRWLKREYRKNTPGSRWAEVPKGAMVWTLADVDQFMDEPYRTRKRNKLKRLLVSGALHAKYNNKLMAAVYGVRPTRKKMLRLVDPSQNCKNFAERNLYHDYWDYGEPYEKRKVIRRPRRATARAKKAKPAKARAKKARPAKARAKKTRRASQAMRPAMRAAGNPYKYKYQPNPRHVSFYDDHDFRMN